MDLQNEKGKTINNKWLPKNCGTYQFSVCGATQGNY